MKKLFILLLAIISFKAEAQFPPPQNFQFSYDYIMIGNSGPCAGNWINGPAYCSHFKWSPPDTNATSGSLEYYNLYYMDILFNDTNIFASVIDTFYNIDNGFIGYMWVTAVYSDPIGESDSSNIVYNEDLPISLDENYITDKIIIKYDPYFQQIEFDDTNEIEEVRLFNIQGSEVMSGKLLTDRIDISELPNGIYLLEVITTDNNLVRKKILK